MVHKKFTKKQLFAAKERQIQKNRKIYKRKKAKSQRRYLAAAHLWGNTPEQAKRNWKSAWTFHHKTVPIITRMEDDYHPDQWEEPDPNRRENDLAAFQKKRRRLNEAAEGVRSYWKQQKKLYNY